MGRDNEPPGNGIEEFGLSGLGRVREQISADQSKPLINYLMNEIDPQRWGWDNLAEWLLDYSGLVEERPPHMGHIRFERDAFWKETSVVEEGVASPPNAQEKRQEDLYRHRVRLIIEKWRLDGKL